MNGAGKIRSTHHQRQAVVYLRQSSTKQVLHHRESAVNQRALATRLRDLGWAKHQVVVLDEDQGQSARDTAGREGFQKLVAEVSLRKVGLIMGYEVSRLSRNCADWHRLLELCALFDTLIADTEGIYHPRDFNDRLLLGLKGTMSEAELHSLRLRLDAGRLSKAKRGDLVQHLPTGYVRGPDGGVQFDPDTSVQQRIGLVFRKFMELGSAQKVLGYLAKNDLPLPRRQTSGLYAGQLLWKPPSSSTLHSILKNPAYAGAFAYGRRTSDPTRRTPGRPASGRIRQPPTTWQALVHDVYPAYITWNDYERIQQQLAENHQKMQDRWALKPTDRQGVALLTGLVSCGLCGHRMSISYKGQRFQYKCDSARKRYAQPTCQYLSGRHIDQAVLEEFFEVLKPAQIDAMQQVDARRVEHQRELITHLQQEVTRLQYAAVRTEKQYNCVDPENRLIAATLEKKWETALQELEQARTKLAQAQAATPKPVVVPPELREAFANVGQRLPKIWPTLSPHARKSLLNTLVKAVHLSRQPRGKLLIRIVWCGGFVSEKQVTMPASSWSGSDWERDIIDQIRQMADAGANAQQIAQRLNSHGRSPCRGQAFTTSIVRKLQHRHGIHTGLEKIRRGGLPGGYTIREMARLIQIDPSWIYRKISQGRLVLPKHPRYGGYLFPKTPETIQTMKQLKNGHTRQASFPEVHHEG